VPKSGSEETLGSPKAYRWYHNITLNAYWFGVSFMWNSLHPIILPTLLLSLTPDRFKNTGYGLLTFVGLVVALVIQPVSGALSDRTRHRWGRRRPWILLGTLLDVGCLFGLALAPNYWLAAISYVLLQFTSNLAHGAAQGLIPDLVPQGKRGLASGIKNLIDMGGIICAALVAGRLLGGFHPRPLLAIAVIACVLVGAMVVTCAGTREMPTSPIGQARTSSGPSLAQLPEFLKVDLRRYRGYARLLVSRYCVFLGSYSVQSFGLYYFRDALHMTDPVGATGSMMAVVGLSITLVTLPAGILSERWGRKGLSLAACAIAAVGMGSLLIARSMTALLVLGSAIGLGMGIFASVNWAWATDLVPPAEAGKYLGLSNLATAGSAATARLLGPVVDLVNAHHAGSHHAGYSMLFLIAAIAALVGLVILIGVPDKWAGTGRLVSIDETKPRPASPQIEV